MESPLTAPQPETVLADEPRLELSGVTKTFPGVTALNNVSFDCRPGEVHALVGENGSGKSTLIKVAAGVLKPDDGVVRVDGTQLRTANPLEARRLSGSSAARGAEGVLESTKPVTSHARPGVERHGGDEQDALDDVERAGAEVLQCHQLSEDLQHQCGGHQARDR